MATVEDDHFVLGLRSRCKSQELAERQAIVAALAVTGAQVSAGRIDVAVSRKVEQRDIAIVLEQLLDVIAKLPTRHRIAGSSGDELLNPEIHFTVAMALEEGLYGERVIHAPIQSGNFRVVVDADDQRLFHDADLRIDAYRLSMKFFTPSQVHVTVATPSTAVRSSV